eukprot:CAMPEP_0206402454 /NCGR_PEP_ID=MMETSP0294-20121207/26990_1 /ASSEMBLY_ACC=CAM_ASM_000327 /TAXON_ID=39354 /ORGANISM="Heterosigma akashiwo, Strain CCMP2393" /LENGTH=139 /DNA_ID=CAMNT_0053859579 /DNA_START=185 /DNA_END=601 /DNA_ORIENTATION=+
MEILIIQKGEVGIEENITFKDKLREEKCTITDKTSTMTEGAMIGALEILGNSGTYSSTICTLGQHVEILRLELEKFQKLTKNCGADEVEKYKEGRLSSERFRGFQKKNKWNTLKVVTQQAVHTPETGLSPKAAAAAAAA